MGKSISKIFIPSTVLFIFSFIITIGNILVFHSFEALSHNNVNITFNSVTPACITIEEETIGNFMVDNYCQANIFPNDEKIEEELRFYAEGLRDNFNLVWQLTWPEIIKKFIPRFYESWQYSFSDVKISGEIKANFWYVEASITYRLMIISFVIMAVCSLHQLIWKLTNSHKI